MLKIGTKVEYMGEPFKITKTKVSASGKNMYMLQSLTDENYSVAAFEESLSYYGEFDSNEKESTGSQNNVLKMNLVCMPLVNGIMAYWAKVEEAASYIISLYINKQVISTRVNERSELYTTFTGLAAIDGATEALFDSLAKKIKSSKSRRKVTFFVSPARREIRWNLRSSFSAMTTEHSRSFTYSCTTSSPSVSPVLVTLKVTSCAKPPRDLISRSEYSNVV